MGKNPVLFSILLACPLLFISSVSCLPTPIRDNAEDSDLVNLPKLPVCSAGERHNAFYEDMWRHYVNDDANSGNTYLIKQCSDICFI